MAVSDAFNGTTATSSAAIDGTTTTAPSTVTANIAFNVSTPGSGLVFNNTITGNYTGSTETAFENDVISAEHILASQATNSATINVELEAVNQGANGDGANNDFLLYPATYAQLKSALSAKGAGNPIGQIAARNLPATDPSSGVGFYLPTSYARFLGLTGASGGVEIVNGAYQFSASFPYDDAVILNTNYISDFGQDAIDAIAHELSEGGWAASAAWATQRSATASRGGRRWICSATIPAESLTRAMAGTVTQPIFHPMAVKRYPLPPGCFTTTNITARGS
jgi:hypothetical protein